MSGDVFAWLADQFPVLILCVIAGWTAWHVRGWKSDADHKIDSVTRALAEHERGCEARNTQMDMRLSRIEQGIAFIRGQVSPREPQP